MLTMHPVEAARRHRRLTQTQLAEKTGLGQSTVSKVERGEILHPHRATRTLLCAALGYTEAALFGDDTPPELLAIMNGTTPKNEGVRWQRVEATAHRVQREGTRTEQKRLGHAMLKVLAAADAGWRDPERGRSDLDDMWELANELVGTTFTVTTGTGPTKATTKARTRAAKARTAPRARGRRSKAGRAAKASTDADPDLAEPRVGLSTRRGRSR